MPMTAIMKFAKQARTTIKVIFNIPDYDKYMKHQRDHHPDQTPLTEKEYYMDCLKERYESGKIKGCC
jgi:uncharacterized short protein YbdD (DUF466 family)